MEFRRRHSQSSTPSTFKVIFTVISKFKRCDLNWIFGQKKPQIILYAIQRLVQRTKRVGPNASSASARQCKASLGPCSDASNRIAWISCPFASILQPGFSTVWFFFSFLTLKEHLKVTNDKIKAEVERRFATQDKQFCFGRHHETCWALAETHWLWWKFYQKITIR